MRDGAIGGLGTPCTRETFEVLAAVAEERHAQDMKWGRQDHPDGTSPDMEYGWSHADGTVFTMAEVAEQAKEDCDFAAQTEILTWFDILQEEFFEALAEEDPARLREELVQVAAVAVAWIEAIDRRNS